MQQGWHLIRKTIIVASDRMEEDVLVGQLFESTNTGCFSITGALNILRGIQYNYRLCSYPARALRALGLLLADGAPTVGRGKTF